MAVVLVPPPCTWCVARHSDVTAVSGVRPAVGITGVCHFTAAVFLGYTYPVRGEDRKGHFFGLAGAVCVQLLLRQPIKRASSTTDDDQASGREYSNRRAPSLTN